MQLSGKTKPYAVLGHPIGHTLSPLMHMAAIDALGMDAIYLALDVKPDRLMSVLPAMQDMGFGGVNLTVPLKEAAFNGLEQLDESSQLVGAVNTVSFGADGLVGYNTDGNGFLRAVDEAFGISVEDRRVFVLGAGGAGRAMALVSARAGAKSVTLHDIDSEKMKQVACEIEAMGSGTEVMLGGEGAPVEELACDAELVIQATPIGMKKDDPVLLGEQAFRNGQYVFDLIYMYPETPLLSVARKAGAKTANGLGMLLHQGAAAFKIWTGIEPPVDIMRTALEKAVYHV